MNDSAAIVDSIKNGEGTFARWVPVPYKYKVATSGVFELNSEGEPSVDKRGPWKEETGVAFTYSGPGTSGADNVMGLNDEYVRLRKSIEGNMVYQLDTAGGTREDSLEADRIHVKKSTLESLYDGNYDWVANKNGTV